MTPNQKMPPGLSISRLGGLLAELDPQNEYGPRRIWAALKSLGLEPEDVDPSREMVIKVSDKIPDKHRAEQIKGHRKTVFKGLQDSRLEELRRSLTSLSDDAARRFERTGGGLRPLQPGDIPEAEDLGMDDFEEMQRQRYARLKAEQQRKANMLATNFLQEKKRMEEADAKVESLEQRLKAYKKEEAEAIKTKRKECDKKTEKREQGAKKAAEERAEWEKQTEDKLIEKLKKAKEAREAIYSKENLKVRTEAAEQQRTKAFDQAVELEHELLAQIEAKQEALEERLEVRRQQIAADLQQRRETSQAKFQNQQLRVYTQKQDWAKGMLQQHISYQDHFKQAQTTGRSIVMQRSKSCTETMRKAADKWKTNHEKLMNGKHEDNAALMERLQNAKERMEAQASLKLKCNNDIFSFKEVKNGTWGELQRRRITAFRNKRGVEAQALIFKIGEACAKGALQEEGAVELRRRRQLISKDALALNDRAKEGFLKIQSEPDERKIVKIMSDMGFNMPKLPDPEEEEKEEKAAF